MHVHAELDAARKRQAGFRAEASARRLAIAARPRRAPTRRALAKVIVSIGFIVVGAGRRLGDDTEASTRRRLRIVS